jgi:hypothetical protein
MVMPIFMMRRQPSDHAYHDRDQGEHEGGESSRRVLPTFDAAHAFR